MPRLSIYSAIWILMLLLHLVVTGNKTYPNLREETLIRDFSSFWKRRLLYENESVETVGLTFSNEISRLDSDQKAKNTNLKKEYKNATENMNSRTLMDYNGPTVMEDLDNKSDLDSANHVRVKRNQPANDSIIRHRSNHSMNSIDSFPQNLWSKINAINVFGDSTFEGSYVDSDRGNRSGILHRIAADMPRSRRKRSVLSKNGQRKKRMRGNIRHSKHRIETNRSKKHGALKSFRKPVMKKTNNSKKKNKKTREIKMPAETISKSQVESRIEKRELENSLNTDISDTTDYEKASALNSQREDAPLINNKSSDEQREGNTVVLPFVHTGKAELRVRIEKIPMNESSFLDSASWTSPSLTTLPKHDVSDEIFDANVTSLELTPNLNSTARKEANLTMEIILRKLDYGNFSNQERNDFGNASFYSAGSRSIESNVPRIENDRDAENGKYDRANEVSAGPSSEDMKSRAKRNQEISTERYLRSDVNATRSRRFEDVGRTSIGNRKREKYERTRGNRAVRSIEEIKQLAEKLIIKINELQIYVSRRNETSHTTDFCIDENADRTAIEEAPRTLLGRKGASGSESKIAENRRRFAKNGERAIPVERRASQMPPSGGSRFSREENRPRKSRRKWGRWMDWSSCSVTCGKGRQIRWRHCLRDCNEAETEMEEKACQLPACPPGKFLGIF